MLNINSSISYWPVEGTNDLPTKEDYLLIVDHEKQKGFSFIQYVQFPLYFSPKKLLPDHWLLWKVYLTISKATTYDNTISQ